MMHPPGFIPSLYQELAPHSRYSLSLITYPEDPDDQWLILYDKEGNGINENLPIVSILASDHAPPGKLEDHSWIKIEGIDAPLYINVESAHFNLDEEPEDILNAAKNVEQLRSYFGEIKERLLSAIEKQFEHLNESLVSKDTSVEKNLQKIGLSKQDFQILSLFIETQNERINHFFDKTDASFFRFKSDEVEKATGLKRTIVCHDNGNYYVQDDKEYLLGEGNYKVLKKVLNLADGQIYAQSGSKPIERDVSILRSEENALKAHEGSRHIIPLLDAIYYESKGMIKQKLTFPLIVKNLSEYLDEKRSLKLDEQLELMQELAEAVGEIHAAKIGEKEKEPFVHKDIKPDNVLRTEEGNLVLIDFGMADKTMVGGSNGYRAPEAYVDRVGDLKHDIFSLGVLYFQIRLCNVDIFPYNNDPATMEGLNHYAKALSHSDKPIDKLIMSMLSLDPTQRPSIEEIKSHEIFD